MSMILSLTDIIPPEAQGMLQGNPLINTQKAFHDGMVEVKELWSKAANGTEPLPGITKLRRGTEYANAIQNTEFKSENPWHILIMPDQTIACFCEEEIPPWDMKPPILAGPNAIRYDKDGKIYKNIPLRHREGNIPQYLQNILLGKTDKPRTVRGRDVRGKGYKTRVEHEVFTHLQKVGVHHAALVNRIRRKTFIMQRGDRIRKSDLRGVDREAVKPHTTPKLLGLIRSEKHYEKATQNQWLTFRYMGAKSPANSWIHPGFPANPISQLILPKAEEILKGAIAMGLGQDLKAIIES